MYCGMEKLLADPPLHAFAVVGLLTLNPDDKAPEIQKQQRSAQLGNMLIFCSHWKLIN